MILAKVSRCPRTKAVQAWEVAVSAVEADSPAEAAEVEVAAPGNPLFMVIGPSVQYGQGPIHLFHKDKANHLV